MSAPERAQQAVTATPQWRLTLRLGLAAGAAFLVAVPFTLLAVLVSRKVDWLQSIDSRVAAALHGQVQGSQARTDLLIVVQEATQPWRLYTIAGVVVVVLVAKRAYRLATWLAITCGAGWFLGWVLKLVVQRSRPSFPDPVELAPGFSFPSGHALNSVVFAGAMVVLLDRVVHGAARAAVWVGGGLFVLLVGFDRVALGVHFASDVLAGWAVGAAVVVATLAGFGTWRRRERG